MLSYSTCDTWVLMEKPRKYMVMVIRWGIGEDIEPTTCSKAARIDLGRHDR